MVELAIILVYEPRFESVGYAVHSSMDGSGVDGWAVCSARA